MSFALTFCPDCVLENVKYTICHKIIGRGASPLRALKSLSRDGRIFFPSFLRYIIIYV